MLVLIVIAVSCSRRDPTLEQVTRETLAHRSEVDYSFRNDPDSPFNRDTTIRYDGIKWFPPDPKYYFQSRLYRYERP